MSPHPEVMPPVQQQVLRSVGPVASELGLYLAGGTAVAIHLGHRESIDLDFFTERPIGDPLLLAAAIRNTGISLEVTSVAKGTLHGTVDGVRVSFLEYPYPSLKPTEEWSEFGCRVASLEDLACMKLSALSSRGARKDFFDLHALGRTTFSLREMLDLYRSKFQTRDVGHVVFSLTYFDDAEAEELPRMRWPVTWDEVKRAIASWVQELA